jgi:hypothetical protein
MKKIFMLIPIFLISVFIGCSQTTDQVAAGAEIKFEDSSHDYGTIPYDGNGTFDFIYTNTGKEPLVLKNVNTSCGCTVPEWPKDPIAPGAKGTIKVKYNTKNIGSFTKTVTVYSNAVTNPVTLKITGTVEAPKQ